MCGIFGAINQEGYFTRSDREAFVKLTDMVSYRGPDASGYKSFQLKERSESNRDCFDVFLGHRRLSIIDLSDDGIQPFTNGSNLWIIFNGEIFNYIELRRELQGLGHSFRTATDTEVILKVYEEWGEEGFGRLNGMWAFALVDVLKRKIVLSRDRFSIKPLYVYRNGGMLYFSSEIKQLLPLMPRKEMNRQAVFVFLEQGVSQHNAETFFEGITKVKPKTNMVIFFDVPKITESVYWKYCPEPPMSWADSVQRFRELFLDSVRIRLRSDVKVGALLSGGLDSSAISLLANDVCDGSLDTYSVISRDKRYSEESFIDALCHSRNIRNTKIYFEQEFALNLLDRVLLHCEEPFGSFSVVAQHSILKKIKEETDLTVILSGQGGDETLLGYLKFYFFYLQGLVSKGRILAASREVLGSLLNRTMLRQFRLSEAKRYLPWLAKKGTQRISCLEGEYEPVWAAPDLTRRQMADIDKYSVPFMTHYEDRNSMAYSLEIRLPFLDYRLVNFLIHLPASMKIRNGWTKYILRQGVPELPDAIKWRRDKQGFSTAESVWIRKDMSDLVHRSFRKSMLGELGVVRDAAVLERYRGFQNGSMMSSHKDTWRVMITEMWARRFLT